MMNPISDFIRNINPHLLTAWQLIEIWWWVLLPFILWKPFTFFWRWWRIDIYLETKVKKVLLEIKIPKEVLKPVRAMESVMNGLRQAIYKPPDWWEKWIDGEVQLSYSFEVASINGETHFFLRAPVRFRNAVEAIIYSQYPDAEIIEVEDYAKKVPSDIPNEEWDLWASDYKVRKPNPYPIKTYAEFETEHEAKEEKRVDPLSALLEVMAKIGPGEQLWVQILAEPIDDEELPWITEGLKIKDELARRAKKESQRPLIMEAADVIISGGVSGEKKTEEKEIFPPEMKLTPGERDIIAGVEKKISKPGFNTSIRFIYLAKKEAYNKMNANRPIFGFFAFYLTENLNGLVPWGKTMTKIHKSWFLPLNLIYERRLYLRKRAILRRYVRRDGPYFPKPSQYPGNFVLNIEELASIYHFPGRSSASAPYVSRVEAKKGEAPPGLPVE